MQLRFLQTLAETVRCVFLLCFGCSSVYAFPPSSLLSSVLLRSMMMGFGSFLVVGRVEYQVFLSRNFLRLSALVMELEGETAQNNSGIKSTRSGSSREERQRGTRCILSGAQQVTQ